MQGTIWGPLGASLLAAMVTSLGLYTIRHFEAWGRRYSIYFVCFAAGVLISVSLLHIIPKSMAMSSAAATWLLTGFLLLHLFNRFITAYVGASHLLPQAEKEHRPYSMAALATGVLVAAGIIWSGG